MTLNPDRIAVREDFESFGIKIQMLESHVGGRHYPDFSKVEMVKIKDYAEIPSETYLRISNQGALELYHELKKYFGDVHDVATLRKDYEHEKTRVDKFINGLIEGKL